MPEIDSLAAQLASADVAMQATAAESLAQLAEDAQPAIVALVQNLSSANDDVHSWCAEALESVGPPTVEQIDELALLASSANSDVAFWAATLLGRAPALALPAVSVLAERANDPSTPEVQKRATWALERIQAN